MKPFKEDTRETKMKDYNTHLNTQHLIRKENIIFQRIALLNVPFVVFPKIRH